MVPPQLAAQESFTLTVDGLFAAQGWKKGLPGVPGTICESINLFVWASVEVEFQNLIRLALPF